eukprot:CAMPEP_0194264160 /NCGR_PEP_ID=MMETSP0158-20130606/47441_1 /TAXON_ID=33649 /ORGANISM="Thalassionema nitzschioides, Strain L26-B" /LENGTH=570 /DNA_ID=CAMNT_0039004389 /DNA_START=77 /DNA_END=1789 /DNA_ORIENTATION=-
MSNASPVTQAPTFFDFSAFYDVDVEPYKKIPLTKVMRQLPRFGYSKNFADLFVSRDDAIDYIQGLIVASIILVSFFLLVGVILLVFKCLGAKRVGFLSGSAFVRPSLGNIKRPAVCRTIFLLSCITFVTFSVLFKAEGVAKLNETAGTTYDSLINAANYTATAYDVLVDLAVIGANSSSIATNMSSLLEDAAGNECIDMDDFIDENGNNYYEIVQEQLGALGDFLPQDYGGLVEASDFMNDRLDTLSSYTFETQIQLGKLYFLIFTIAYVVTPSILLAGVLLAWFKMDAPNLRYMLSWLVLPCFCFQVFLVSILSAILIVSEANADFCSGGQEQTPGQTILQILQNIGVDAESLKFQLIAFYIGECDITGTNPYTPLQEYLKQLREVIQNLQSFDFALRNVAGIPQSIAADFFTSKVDEDQIRNLVRGLISDGYDCGEINSRLSDITEDLTSTVYSLVNSTLHVFDLLKCGTIVPLYTLPAHDAACTQSVSSLSWIFFSFVLIATTGLIMIMLRSSWQLDINEKGDVDSDDAEESEIEYSPDSMNSWEKELSNGTMFDEEGEMSDDEFSC